MECLGTETPEREGALKVAKQNHVTPLPPGHEETIGGAQVSDKLGERSGPVRGKLLEPTSGPPKKQDFSHTKTMKFAGENQLSDGLRGPGSKHSMYCSPWSVWGRTRGKDQKTQTRPNTWQRLPGPSSHRLPWLDYPTVSYTTSKGSANRTPKQDGVNTCHRTPGPVS